MDISKHLEREMHSIDIGQQLMPGRTRGQTREALAIAEENFDNFYMECAMMSAIVGTIGNDEPRNFKEAWWHTDQIKKRKWRKAIRKKLSDMITRGVWKNVPLDDVPEGRRLIGSKWVFKEKRDGRFHAQLVCLGYSQVPGVDFSDNFAPVVNDVTFRVVQVIRMMLQLDAVLVDVETAFLYGVLNEEIYMKVPEGYKEVYGELNDTALLLIMALYGLVQAARKWFQKLSEVLITKMNFMPSQADPCLMYRNDEDGLCIVLMYVDDNLVIGNETTIQKTVEQLKKEFNVTVKEDTSDYLGCEVLTSENKRVGWIGQPHLHKNLQHRFGTLTNDMKIPKTPSPPGFHVVRPTTETSKIDDKTQKLFRSGVGMLLYLVKHSRPDLSNCTRELSKVMDGATTIQ